MNGIAACNLVAFAALLLVPPAAVRAADAVAGCGRAAHEPLQRRLDQPVQGRHGVMPIGNGDIAAGVYAIENGDLYLLLAKNDAYNYLGDIYKTGRVRISLDPNPFQVRASRSARRSICPPARSGSRRTA